jgi:hypothetical protein
MFGYKKVIIAGLEAQGLHPVYFGAKGSSEDGDGSYTILLLLRGGRRVCTERIG